MTSTNIDNIASELHQDKQRVFLKLLNRILCNIQKDKFIPITKFEEFNNIFGKDIRNDEIENIRKTMENEIVVYFDKDKLKFSQRGGRKYYTFCLIGFMANEMGYSFERTLRKDTTRKINGEYKKFTLLYYSIIKK